MNMQFMIEPMYILPEFLYRMYPWICLFIGMNGIFLPNTFGKFLSIGLIWWASFIMYKRTK